MIYKKLNKNISQKGLLKITTASDVDKAYVDNLDKENVKLTGDQNIYGSKTIKDHLRIDAKYIFMSGNEIVDLTLNPKEKTSATCKEYVDNGDKVVKDYVDEMVNRPEVWEYITAKDYNRGDMFYTIANISKYKKIYFFIRYKTEGNNDFTITPTTMDVNLMKTGNTYLLGLRFPNPYFNMIQIGYDELNDELNFLIGPIVEVIPLSIYGLK